MGFKSGFVKCFFLSLMILFVGCAELTGLREEKVLMTQRIEDLQRENEGLGSRYAMSEGENARLIEERNRLENAQRSMEERLKGTGVSVKIKEGHISVVLPSSVLFNSGQTKLKKEAAGSLSQVCRIIKKDFPGETIRIEGHTDNDPIKRTKQLYKTNWELSAARAATVLHYLIDNCHLDPNKLYLAGFGEYQPVASNKNKKDKKKNRRVEIVVLTD
ncbi:MAG: flagellar motor protein MotB [Candidatus Scalindua rubra]|uniref:Putative chemotaxis protein n=1 Tax=Candidatus Scalindua brodae TaxID=237368 RepID=A0A0B0EE82_9BACT|nr:MAG: putative chemotaxis protein [Candidatus Scalindua brodae]MBZ0107677.1 flagellar motor protein MotB [Candidatus Scalindua rubra]TWU35566.1 putative lipoprotein YiaD precursor [Candidatus Brocadiaceae bacterium S225]